MNSEVSNEAMQLIDEFYRQADEIVNSFAWKLDEKPPPSLIYHYTDGEGLRGILESGGLWLTDIFNLNDPTELRHGLKHAVEILKQRAEKGPREIKVFSEIFQKMEHDGLEQIAHYFVCCFSKDGDDLGQWRAYADNGRGYAIGFDGVLLVQAFVDSATNNSNHWTFPITYEDDELREMHENIIDKFIPLYSYPGGRNFASGQITGYLRELSTRFAEPILRSALLFKHKAYTNEQEYRFLQVHQAGPLDGVKHRNRPYSLIRYREFDWRTVAARSLKKIIIGPAADKSLAHQFADDCLRAFHRVAGVEIAHSDIPYRAL